MVILWFLCILFSLIGVATSQPATGTPAPSPLGFDSAPTSVSEGPSPASAPQAPNPNDDKTSGGVTTAAPAPPEQGITTPLPTTSMGFQSPPTSVSNSPTTTSVPQTSTSNSDKTSRAAATTAPAPTRPVTGTPSPTQLGFQSATSPVPERPKTTRETQKPTSNADKPTGGVVTTAPAESPAPPLTFGGASSATTDTSNSHTSAFDDGSQDEGTTSGSSAAAAKAEATTTNDWKEKYESFESECGSQECSGDCMTTLVALVYNIPDNTADDGVNYYQMLVDILQGCSSSVSSMNADGSGSMGSGGSSSTHRQSSSASHSTTDSGTSSSTSNSDGAGSDNAGDGDIGAGSNSGLPIAPRALGFPVVTVIVTLLLSVGY